jgi:hypothetical protein
MEEALQADGLKPGWVKGWMVLHTKQALAGDFVSIHDHAAQAQAEAQRLGAGHQVFHGSHRLGSDEFLID